MRWTAVSTGQMTMIADPRIVQTGANDFSVVTPHRATVRLPLLFRQCFHKHIGEYEIFHAMRQVFELPRTTLQSSSQWK